MEAVTPKKRPWYLVLALVLCTSFGACGWFDGYQSILFYRDTQIDTPSFIEQLPESTAKARAREAATALVQERDATRKQGFPLAAATFVVGAAVLLFTARAFANRGTSKQLLIQFVLVQTALIFATHFALPGIRNRRTQMITAFDHAHSLARAKTDTDRAQADQAAAMISRMGPAIQVAGLGVRATSVLFVLIALTRRRTREFYGEVGSTVGGSGEVDPPNPK